VLDKENLIGGGVVVATLNLPAEVNFPGANLIRVGARQRSKADSGMGIVSNVWGIIKVNVPYPGKYVELDLKAPNANAGEVVNLSFEIFNRGEEDVTVSSYIQIFRNESLIENINLGNANVASLTSVIVESPFDSSGYSVGDYNAIVFGEYGPAVATDENPFKLGELFVKIVDCTREFRENKLERFEIEIESFYNNDIDDLYAEVNVVEIEGGGFMTPIGVVNAWDISTLEGFLDTSEIDSENFLAEIILHYGEETTTEVVDLKIILNKDYTFIFVLIGCILVVGFLGWKIVVFVKRICKKKKK